MITALKYKTKEQKEINENGRVILEKRWYDMGNLEESQVVKHGGKYYLIEVVNKNIRKFEEV